MQTPRANTKTNQLFRSHHLKRVPITIQSKKNPELVVAGYALSHEILSNQISFFSTQKFPLEETLVVNYEINGETHSVPVTLDHLHEQISSGRVMNAVPDDQHPFPTRIFYRCYTSVNGAAAATGETTATAPETVPSDETSIAA